MGRVDGCEKIRRRGHGLGRGSLDFVKNLEDHSLVRVFHVEGLGGECVPKKAVIALCELQALFRRA